MSSRLRFAEHSWEEIAGLPRDSTVLFLPVGSTEPHGPHLPLATDVIISEGMAARAATRLEEKYGLRALILPSILYSVTDFAVGFAGVISLRFDTARDVMIHVLSGAARDGFRMICIANSHLEPRHVVSIAEAIERVASETDLRIAFPDKRRRKWAERLTAEFKSGACHAGQYETSLVLADRPDLVREDIRESLPPVETSLSSAIRKGKVTFRDAGGTRAYFGRPAEATSEEGESTFDALASMLVESVEETYGLGGVRD